jgi:hypothetical protein
MQDYEAELASSLISWRTSLPEVLQIKVSQLSMSEDVMWPMVLMATSYRFECIFYRILCKRYQTADRISSQYLSTEQRLHAAMFELDAIIGRVMAYDMLPLLNLPL